VLMDEVFGRSNFINDIVWKRRGGSANPNNRLNNVTDFLLWYAKRSQLRDFSNILKGRRKYTGIYQTTLRVEG
jgi:adenine-specific DNA-methyltransferase